MSEDKRLSGLKNTLTKVSEVVENLAAKLKDLNSQISQLSGNSTKLSKTQSKVAKETEKAAKETEKQAKATKEANKESKGFFANLGKNIKTIVSFYGAYQVLNLALSAFRELTLGSAQRAIALEKSLGDLAAVAGLTTDEVSRLKDVVFEVAGATSLTATEVVALQKELAKLGTPVEDIEKLTRPIALLSQALGEEPGGVAATLKKTLNQFQATTEEADRFANVLTGAVNETALSLNDLGTALSYVGPLGAQLGMSIEDTVALIGLLADNGFKASKAGTGLRSILLATAKDGRSFNEFFGDLAEKGLDANEALAIFGKTAVSQALVLVNNIDRYKELSEELTVSNRLFEANAKQMATTQGQLDLLASAYDKLSTRIGDVVTRTNAFIDLIAILDNEAAGLAQSYKFIANASEDTADEIDNLREELRKFGVESSTAGDETIALGQAFGLLQRSGDFSQLAIKDALFEVNYELEQGATLYEAFEAAQQRGFLGAQRLASATIELFKALRAQAQGQDDAFIAMEANNDVVKRYKDDYESLVELTQRGINVDKEKAKLQQQINIDVARYTGELQSLRANQVPTADELERIKILEKRIALLNEQSLKAGKLEVSEKTLGEQRKEQDKEAKERFKTDLTSYIERIKETEKAIADLPEGVSDKVFTQQVDLLDGFFGSAEDIIAQATERFGSDSEFVKSLTEILNKSAQEVSIELPEDPFADVVLDPGALLGFEEEENNVVKKVTKLKDKINQAFKGLNLGEVIKEGLDTAAEAISEFNDVALENTVNRLESEKTSIDNRYEVEQEIIKSQLDNQLITESQFRVKKRELQRAEIAEQNSIDKQIFDSEKKRDKQNASTDYLQAVASIIPTLIAYDKTADPVSVLTKAAITGALATAAYGAELSAISQRKFFPKKFEQGGMVSGPSHAEGGVPFTVKGQSGYEMEGGEFIVNKKATAMHRDLLERINNSQRTRPQVGKMKFAQGGMVPNNPAVESVDYLKAIAEATTSTAIQSQKPLRAYVSDADLRNNANERRLRDRNDRI